MQNRKREIGVNGERMAAEYLAERGVTIIARNARTPYGELDLVGFQSGVLVFFEVKTRRTNTYGNPEDSVSSVKRKHLVDSAQAFVQDHPELPASWRIDVIAINIKPGQKPEIEWFENAVS